MAMNRDLRGSAKGQSAMEMAILLVLAAAALAWMFPYVRSAVSHHFKGGADGIGHGLLYPD
jgi:hypothetical protein